MEPLFPALPEDLGEDAFTDEQLQAALDERLAAVEKIEAEDAEFLGDRSAQDVLAELQAGVEQIEAIRAEQTSREEGAAEYQASVAELVSKAKGPDKPDPDDDDPPGPDPDDEKAEAASELAAEPEAEEAVKPEGWEIAEETTEVVTEKVEEPVVASAERPRVHRRPPRAAKERQPVTEDPDTLQLIASAGIRGVTPGMPLDRDSLAKALLEAHRVTSAADARTRVIVASADLGYPESRRLDDNPAANTEKIESVVGRDALVASGGICAPPTPFYDLNICGAVQDRPVKAALAGFQATRGGISYPTPLDIADLEDGVGIVTAEDDAAGGTFATKNCVVVDCDPYTDEFIEAIYACIEHGNFGARTWPERVSALADLLAVQHAKVAEIELLDKLSAGSIAVTDEAKYGATSTLLQGILKAAAGQRSRHRMDPRARLRALFPAWAADLLVADMVHQPYDRFERTRDGLVALLSSVGGINASFYLDGPTGGGQIWGAQSTGALLEFPTTVVWYLFAEGTWLFLDGGELDLGIVRDSTLNSTNDFQIFMETFEGAARVGCESFVVTSTLCPNGAYPAGSTAFTC